MPPKRSAMATASPPVPVVNIEDPDTNDVTPESPASHDEPAVPFEEHYDVMKRYQKMLQRVKKLEDALHAERASPSPPPPKPTRHVHAQSPTSTTYSAANSA